MRKSVFCYFLYRGQAFLTRIHSSFLRALPRSGYIFRPLSTVFREAHFLTFIPALNCPSWSLPGCSRSMQVGVAGLCSLVLSTNSENCIAYSPALPVQFLVVVVLVV